MKRRRIKRVQNKYAIVINGGFLLDRADNVEVFNLYQTASVLAESYISKGHFVTIVPVRVTVEEMEE